MSSAKRADWPDVPGEVIVYCYPIVKRFCRRFPTYTEDFWQAAKIAAWLAQRDYNPQRGDRKIFTGICVRNACISLVGTSRYWQWRNKKYRRQRRDTFVDPVKLANLILSDDYETPTLFPWDVLTDREALVVSLHLASDLSYNDIAAELKLNASTVARTFSRAMTKLDKYFSERLDGFAKPPQ